MVDEAQLCQRVVMFVFAVYALYCKRWGGAGGFPRQLLNLPFHEATEHKLSGEGGGGVAVTTTPHQLFHLLV